MSTDPKALAQELIDAYANKTIVPAPSSREGGIDLDTAYAVEAEIVKPLAKRIEKRYEKILTKTRVVKIDATPGGLRACWHRGTAHSPGPPLRRQDSFSWAWTTDRTPLRMSPNSL